MQTKTLAVLGAFALIAIAGGTVERGLPFKRVVAPVTNEITTGLSQTNSQEVDAASVASSTSAATSTAQ